MPTNRSKSKKELLEELTRLRSRLEKLELGSIPGYSIRAGGRSERGFQTIIQTTLDGFWICDSKGSFLDVNDAYCQMIGYNRAELLRMSVPDIEAMENPDETAQHIKKIIEQGYDRFETQHQCKDGSIIDVEISTNYVEEGGRFFVFIQDITERKQAEKERKTFHELSQRLTTILSIKDIGRIVANGTRNLYQHDAFSLDLVNESKEMLTGVYNEDTPEGKSSPKEFPARSIPFDKLKNKDVLLGHAKLINRKDEPPRSEFTLFGEKTRLSRSLMFVPVVWEKKTIGILSVQSYTPGKYGKGDLKHLHTFANQCAGAMARVWAEESLRRMGRGIESAGEAMLMTDLEGTIQYVNPAFSRLTGFTLEEAVGQNPRILKSGKRSKSFYKQMWETVINGEIWDGEITNRHKDGTFYDVILTIAPVFDPRGELEGFVAIQNDISERKRAEKEKEQLIADLQEALDNIKTLKGLIPICAWCHKIRDDEGYWSQIETYLGLHTEAEFSHGICPECQKKTFGRSR